MTQLAQNLRDDGAHVALEPLDADHFLLLTHADAWTARAAGWISERSAVASPAGP